MLFSQKALCVNCRLLPHFSLFTPPSALFLSFFLSLFLFPLSFPFSLYLVSSIMCSFPFPVLALFDSVSLSPSLAVTSRRPEDVILTLHSSLLISA